MKAIMSGDPKAVEKLQEKLAVMEKQRDDMKLINKQYKKAVQRGKDDKSGSVADYLFAFMEEAGHKVKHETCVKLVFSVENGQSWEKQPYPKWKVTNLGASIRTVKKRIEQLTPKAERIAVKKKVDYVGEIIKKHGAFFCFSTEQFTEQREEGVSYVALDGGLCVPVKAQDELVADIGKAAVQAVLDDKQTSTNKEIIWRELSNHEAQYSGCIDSTVEALQGYEITREDVQAEMLEFLKGVDL